MSKQRHYYVPESSQWPIVASLGLFVFLSGVANWIHGHFAGLIVTVLGTSILIYMMVGWFGDVIMESRAGCYGVQVDRSFRWGMIWFIFSEICFFGVFFGALFYARLISVPNLSGNGFSMTHFVLWPHFLGQWPLLVNPNNHTYLGPDGIMFAWGLPALNTLLLLTSGVTITWAHWALKMNQCKQLLIAMFSTVSLGVIFLCCQIYEYYEAYHHLGLTLDSGIYGTTFFMLTGFHGLHVTLGTIMLMVITRRCFLGHFSKSNHFAFEAVAWYWHFVDVVWLFLFVFVYWL